MSFKDIFQTSHSIIILRHEKYGDEYIPICPCYGMWKYKGIKREETVWKSLDDIYVENDGSYICEWMDDYHSDIEDAVSEICNRRKYPNISNIYRTFAFPLSEMA